MSVKERAFQLASHTQNPDKLGGIIPLTSVARNDADFVASGEYWRGGIVALQQSNDMPIAIFP